MSRAEPLAWLAEERSPVLVKEAMVHADVKTTMAYTRLAWEHLRAQARQALC